MSKNYKEYLKHILKEINYLLNSSEKIDKGIFMEDENLKRAYTRSIGIIGEAAKKLPEKFRHKNSHVDWRSMTGMRDNLIHEYFGIDYDIVWDVVENEIEKLKRDIEKLL